MEVSTGKIDRMGWPKLLRDAETVVTATMAELPDPVRKILRDVPILMEAFPSPEDVDSGIESDTLGFFDEDAVGIMRIRLWLENIQEYALDNDLAFTDEVRTTLLHEIGHVLGWNEEDLEERGLE